jgi:magnesium transporter
MPRFIKSRKNKKDIASGSLVFIGDRKVDSPRVTLIDYDDKKLKEIDLTDLELLKKLKDSATVSWLNLYGIHDPELLQKFGDIFDIPVLFLEGILNTDQRPRFEDGEKNLGFILKMMHFNQDGTQLEADQISIVLGEKYVISFQEQSSSFFEPVRNRIRNAKGKVRLSGTDYLVYVLLDNIIDNYLNIIAILGDQIEYLGREIIANPNEKYSSEFYKFKIEISFLRKNVRPVKEMILLWLKSDTLLVNSKTKPFLLDLASLITQAEENIEIYNDLLIDGMNTYNANISHRANEIVKVLTMFSAIFIPLTFLVGIYGMNFKYFPELGFRFSYPIFWGVVLASSAALLIFFRRRKWF